MTHITIYKNDVFLMHHNPRINVNLESICVEYDALYTPQCAGTRSENSTAPHLHYDSGVRYLWFLETDQTEISICEKVLVLEGRTARWYASWQEKNAT